MKATENNWLFYSRWRQTKPLYLRAREELRTFTLTCNDAVVLVVASDGLISVYVRLGWELKVKHLANIVRNMFLVYVINLQTEVYNYLNFSKWLRKVRRVQSFECN